MFEKIWLDDRDLLIPSPHDQAARPHVFVNKLPDRPGSHRARRWVNNGPGFDRAPKPWDFNTQEYTSIHAAADFAAYSGMLLDCPVTLDIRRLGGVGPGDAQRILSQFLRCYAAWCSDHSFPSAWIAVIEVGHDGNYHAHIALYVPADHRGLRTKFRTWARTYTDRRGGHVARAIKVRGGRVHSVITHWISIAYLAKGFDRDAVLCSARNSPDGMPIRLADIIPRHYRDPGPVATSRRISISNSIGPARRAIGVPAGLDHLLSTRPDWSSIDLWRMTELTPEEKSRPYVGIPVPAPFRSTLEDGIYDVRRLYPPEFYEFVTKLPHAPSAVEISEDGESSASALTRHLRDLYDE